MAFAETAEEVVEGETRRFDEAMLLWIGADSPGWLDEPVRAVTALGYYDEVVTPLLAATAYVFYRLGRRILAALLVAWRRLVAALGILLVLLIGLSRLYLSVHYPTDILAGFSSPPRSGLAPPGLRFCFTLF